MPEASASFGKSQDALTLGFDHGALMNNMILGGIDPSSQGTYDQGGSITSPTAFSSSMGLVNFALSINSSLGTTDPITGEWPAFDNFDHGSVSPFPGSTLPLVPSDLSPVGQPLLFPYLEANLDFVSQPFQYGLDSQSHPDPGYASLWPILVDPTPTGGEYPQGMDLGGPAAGPSMTTSPWSAHENTLYLGPTFNGASALDVVGAADPHPGVHVPIHSTSGPNLTDLDIYRSTSVPPATSPARDMETASITSSVRACIEYIAGRVSPSSDDSSSTSLRSKFYELSITEFLDLFKESKWRALSSPGTWSPRSSHVSILETNSEAKLAPSFSCCSNVSHASCVHERLKMAIQAKPPKQELEQISPEETTILDAAGNNLLHFAAHLGASASILLQILAKTPLETSFINNRSETFLHVWDPPSRSPIKVGDFIELIKELKCRGFDVCQRDVAKRNFLHCLVPRHGFPLSALACLFCETSWDLNRALVVKKSTSGERLYHCVLRRLEGDLKSGGTARELRRVRQQIKNPVNEHVGAQLRRDRARLESRMKNELKDLRDNIVGDEVTFLERLLPEVWEHKEGMGPSNADGASTRASSQSSRKENCPGTNRDSDNPQTRADRTPLMEYFMEIGRSGERVVVGDPVFKAKMQRLLAQGDDMKTRSKKANPWNRHDNQGNTALHYAAELGIFAGVEYLCRTKGIKLDQQNSCGNTPLTSVRYALLRSEGAFRMEVLYFLCATKLIQAGARERVGGSDLVFERSTNWLDASYEAYEKAKGGKENEKKAMQALLKRIKGRQTDPEPVAREPCRGLHLLG